MGIQIDRHSLCDIFSREKKCDSIVEGDTTGQGFPFLYTHLLGKSRFLYNHLAD